METVAHELGVGVATLERWRAEALGGQVRVKAVAA